MRGKNPRMSQLLKQKKRKILMQNIQTWRYIKQGHSTRGWCLAMLCRGSVGISRRRTWDYGLIALGYAHKQGFSPEAARLLVREQGLDSIERLRVLIEKNVHDICNVERKPGGKNVNGMPDKGQQVSVIAQENLKLVPSHSITGGDSPKIVKLWECM